MIALKPPKESVIQRSILDALTLAGCAVWRINVGMIPDSSGGFRRSLMKGMADIIGVKPGGAFIAVEVKRPGGKTTLDQDLFLAKVRAKGGIAIVAHSAAEALSLLGLELP